MSERKKPKLLKSDTRQWTSGRVRLSVVGIPGHPEKNYIVLEKNFFGFSPQEPQKFILRLHDWENLKRLIEGDGKVSGLARTAQWARPIVVDAKNIQNVIKEKPELIEVVLAAPNIAKLSETSLEALDRLAIKVFEVKRETIDLIFKRLAESTARVLKDFASLLEDLRLSQISMLSSLVYQKLRLIDLLEEVTTDPAINEDVVHEIFENNGWLLGKGYEIIQSDKSLTKYLEINIKTNPETGKRPDLLVKRIPYTEEVIIVELKAPGIKLAASHIGQILEYKAIISKNKPNIKRIHCFLFGYEKASTFTLSKDVNIKTFSELISELRDEYSEYSKVLEKGKEEHITT